MPSLLKKRALVNGVLALLITASVSLPSLASDVLSPPSIDARTWPRMTADAFGCYLEKQLGHRDPRFNCALKHYENKGDPCKNTDAYYEGPAFPPDLATRVHPLATDVQLDWEHGELQNVTITLKGTWNENEVRRVFKLADTHASNIMSVDVQYPTGPVDDSVGHKPSDPMHGSTAVMLTGFDHMGAGDVDCGGE
jgi:hypothetical protein